MALSSQSLNKRRCQFGFNDNGNVYDGNNRSTMNPNNKRICLGISKDLLSYHSVMACYSSSDNDNDSEDEQSCYRADQIKAKRRASTRMSFSVNPSVSRAVAKYSDEDEEHFENEGLVDDNIDCKLLSSSVSNNNSSVCLGKLKRRSHSSTSSFHLSDEQATNTITKIPSKVENIASQAFSGNMKRSVPCSDKNARSHCFDYLVSAIDEAWARYCTATSYTEDEEEEADCSNNAVTPASVATDDEDYFGNSTDITDYEDSDYGVNHNHKSYNRSPTGKPQMYQKSAVTSMTNKSHSDPSSNQLQALKDRLTKAKYYLQDLVDSEDVNDVALFWKRWDMIKYATIELVEDDDDDDVVENAIEELENGRFYTN